MFVFCLFCDWCLVFVFAFLSLNVLRLSVFVLFVWYVCVCFFCLGVVGLFLFCV